MSATFNSDDMIDEREKPRLKENVIDTINELLNSYNQIKSASDDEKPKKIQDFKIASNQIIYGIKTLLKRVVNVDDDSRLSLNETIKKLEDYRNELYKEYPSFYGTNDQIAAGGKSYKRKSYKRKSYKRKSYKRKSYKRK